MKRIVAIILSILLFISPLSLHWFEQQRWFADLWHVDAMTTQAAASSHSPTHGSTTSAVSVANDVVNLKRRLSDVMADYTTVTTSVSFIDLTTGQQYDFGSSAATRGASTTKIITAVDYLHEVELGHASLDQLVGGQTARSLLQRMITDSDNDAWYAFLNYLSYGQVTEYGKSIGLTAFDAFYNTLTAHDEAVVMQELYDGQLINQDHTRLLYSFMHHTNDDTLIPAAIPRGATVYHKYGYLYGYVHDAAIVEYEGRAFVLVIYTNDEAGTLDDLTARTQLFHDITTDVLQYALSM